MTKKQEDKWLSEFTEDLTSEDLNDAQIEEIFVRMSKIEDIDRFLVQMMKKDRVMFFNIVSESQERVKGQFLRAYHFLKKIRSKRVSDKDNKKARSSFNEKGGFSA